MDYLSDRRLLKQTIAVCASSLALTCLCPALEFDIVQIADENAVNRDPVISETGVVVWQGSERAPTGESSADIFYYKNAERFSLTSDTWPLSSDVHPQAQSNTIVWQTTYEVTGRDVSWILKEVPTRDEGHPELWALPDYTGTPSVDPNIQPGVQDWGESVSNEADAAVYYGRFEGTGTETNSIDGNQTKKPDLRFRRHPSGDNEICIWRGEGDITRITEDYRNDLGPSFWGDLVAWQKAKAWPFGWEIMVWDSSGYRAQLTTNYYYDMGTQVHKDKVVWYGWDGQDFEIFLYDHTTRTQMQITSNHFDDVSPYIWNGEITWEAYPAVESDVYLWRDGKVRKLSGNIDDDLNPRIADGKVVWQGFDGDDFEIYYFNGERTIKLTSNTYDDVDPQIRDGLIVWMGYHDNWDAEIFASDLTDTKQLTDNDYEDRTPMTASGRIVWQADHDGKSEVYLATPKP